ncbi:MAG: hypothetical protein C0421_05650 [Hyphomonas sp.]|uniref:hypothetical protein n=1 Tax=Hyphomonas sp. TaxID=87 RepID=UPI0025C1819F|nr:hypothetical protein [Hyphomonas sp.]MBA4338311.1 hypothetical protein [Hyphomonas sp.]
MGINSPPTALELQNAGTDLNTIDQFTNGAADLGGTGTINTRRGGPIKTLAWFVAQIETARLGMVALLASLTGREAEIAVLTDALAPGQPLDIAANEINNIIAASGIYPVPMGDHDDLEDEVINDPRVTVTREEERNGETVEVRYRPRVLPFTITLPFDPDDWFEMASQGGASSFVLAELRRLATYHPPVAPSFGVDRAYSFEAGSSGTIVNLASLVTDADSPPENLTFEALSALPTGVTLTGSILARTTPPIQAALPVTFRVTDESGLTDTVVITLHSYDPVAPPTTPPVWSALPVLALTRGLAMPALNVRSFLTAGTTPLAAITITASGVPTGLTAADGVLSGTPTVNGGFSITWTATDAFGAAVQYVQTVNIAAGAAPVWSSIPGVTITLGQTLPPVRYDLYLNGGPYAVSAISLGVSGAPSGTALTSRELRGVPAAIGTYTVTVTGTNPAGAQSAVSHVITVNPPPATGGGGSGGNGGPGNWFEERNVD